MNLISADWIERGGRPNQSGYLALHAGCGQLAREIALAHIQTYVPGTPKDEQLERDPAALPWVWFSPVNQNAASLSVAIMRIGSSTDADNRRQDPTNCFFVNVNDLLSVQTSYLALYRGFGAISLPTIDGGPVTIEPAALDTVAIAQRPDLERLVAIASVLLTEPISLTSPEFHSTTQRVTDIDAIVAMLPYGFRADLAAASWMEGNNSNTRLSFGGVDRTGRLSVNWDQNGTPVAIGPAHAYQSRLLLLFRQLGPEAVLAFLAQDSQPRHFGQPEAAMAYLAPLAEPIEVWHDILLGVADHERVRRIVRSGPVPERAIEDFALFLLFRGSSADLPLVSHLVRGSVSDRVLIAIIAAAYSHVDAPDGNAWFRLAEHHGVLDDALVTALRGNAGVEALGAALPAASIEATPGAHAFPEIEIKAPLIEIILASLAEKPAPDLGTVFEYWPEAAPSAEVEQLQEARAEIRSNPALVYVLAEKLLEKDESVDLSAALVGFGVDLSQPSPDLVPLASVGLDGLEVPRNAIDVVRSLHPPQHLNFLYICHILDRSADAIRLLWEWLPSSLAKLNDAEWAGLGNAVDALRNHESLSEKQSVQALLLGLALELDPLSLLNGTTLPSEPERFERLFQETYSDPTFRPVREIALAHVTNKLQVQSNWGRSPRAGQALDAMRVMIDTQASGAGAWSTRSEPLRNAMETVIKLVAREIRSSPHLVSLPEFAWWRNQLNNRGFAFYLTLASIEEQISNGADAFRLGNLVAEALATANSSRGDHGQLLAALTRTNPNNNPLWVPQFLVGVVSRLHVQGWTVAQRRESIDQFLAAATTGPLRMQWGESLGVLAASILPDLLHILTTTIETATELIDSDTRVVLHESAARIEEITRDSRRLFPRRGRDAR